MRLPSFSDLIEEQLAVYESPPDQSILVIGPPGSGKTSMAIWRARLLASPELNQSVVLVTRNRLLASVAGQLAREQNGRPISATTMNNLMSMDYSRRFGRYIPQWWPFSYKWEEILDDYKKADVTPLYDHIIIDEGQNLPAQFFEWAARFGGRTISVFADENQSTLGEGTTVADLRALGFNEVLPLLVNHRNTKEIVDLLEQFHLNRILPRAMPSRGQGYDRPYLLKVSSWDNLADIVKNRHQNRAESIGIIVYYKDDVSVVSNLLRERLVDTRIDSYTSDKLQGAEAAIKIRDHGITVISGESAIGLEFDTVYLQDLSRSLPNSNALSTRRLYMLCARARDNLVLVNGPQPLSDIQLNSLPLPPILER